MTEEKCQNTSPRKLAEDLDLFQINDEEVLRELIRSTKESFPKIFEDYQNGKTVAKKAIVKKRLIYTNKNLTKIVQRIVGVAVDGKCGKNTEKAIIAYQKKHGLTADGEVGINTWKKILNI